MQLSPTGAFRTFGMVMALAWIAYVFYASTGATGDAGIPSISTTTAYYGHALVYGVLAFFVVTLSLSRDVPFLVGAILACVAIGLAIEVYQAVIPGRSAQVYDVVANLAGAVIGGVAAWTLVPVWRWGLSKLPDLTIGGQASAVD